jgi:hypothetical protein
MRPAVAGWRADVGQMSAARMTLLNENGDSGCLRFPRRCCRGAVATVVRATLRGVVAHAQAQPSRASARIAAFLRVRLRLRRLRSVLVSRAGLSHVSRVSARMGPLMAVRRDDETSTQRELLARAVAWWRGVGLNGGMAFR